MERMHSSVHRERQRETERQQRDRETETERQREADRSICIAWRELNVTFVCKACRQRMRSSALFIALLYGRGSVRLIVEGDARTRHIHTHIVYYTRVGAECLERERV